MMAEDKVPLAREEVEVAKRRVETGEVTVRKVVHEELAAVSLDLMDQRVEIRRVPVDRFVDGPIPDRMDGDTLIISVLREVVVVEKRLKLVEEVHLTRHATVTPHREEVPVRREEAVVRREQA